MFDRFPADSFQLVRCHGVLRCYAMLALLAGLCLLPQAAVYGQDRVTPAQNRAIRKIASGIDRAEKLYTNQRLKQSADAIKEASDELQDLVKGSPSATLLAAVRPQHARLQQARDILNQAGQTLASIPDLPAAAVDPDAPVSFVREVAPMLNTTCGRCHVQGQRGQFSMANFNRLASGVGGAPVIVPGKADESRLIEVMEEGSMPPSGQGLSEESIARLKKWIDEGANFDGEDRTASVAEMAAASGRPANANLTVVRPTGSETVSFSTDIAPVLMQNCMGCHFEAQNAQGGLRLDNFRQFLNGGDSGPIIRPGDAENSILFQRLTASDNTRMPRRRPALDKAIIDKVAKWIEEGARFDGRTARMNLREVNAIARSEAATHEELTAERHAAARRDWKKVMSDIDFSHAAGKEVEVLGTPGVELLQEISKFSDSVAGKIKSKLSLDKQLPMVKGQVVIYAFQRRYDYSEFGKMVETRDLPKHWKAHWNYNTVSAYAVMLLDDDAQFNAMKPELTQKLAAITVASLSGDVPEWFANGMGYVVAEQIVKDKKTITDWQQKFAAAVQSMNNPTDFLQGRLANDSSGLVAYAFVKSLSEGNSMAFNTFLSDLKGGRSFEESFADAWSASPVDLIRQQFGGNNRPRRNRR